MCPLLNPHQKDYQKKKNKKKKNSTRRLKRQDQRMEELKNPLLGIGFYPQKSALDATRGESSSVLLSLSPYCPHREE